MSQVNFIQQHILFMEYGKRNKLSSHERLFYVALFYCANNLAMQAENHEWPEDYFPVSNSDLNGWTGFDERAIRNLRNRLKQKGLIDFKKGDGKKKDPEYKIFYLRRTDYKIVPDRNTTADKNAPDKATDCKFVPDSVGDNVGDSVPDSVVIDCENAPDPYFSNSNNIYNKNKKINTKGEGEEILSYPIHTGEDDAMRSDWTAQYDMLSEEAVYEEIVKHNINYDDLLITHKHDVETIDGIVQLIVETAICRDKEIVIASRKYPTNLVKSKMLKLGYSDIEYILYSLNQNTTKIHNIKKYLLATIFNAKSTNAAYWATEVNHDMHDSRQKENK